MKHIVIGNGEVGNALAENLIGKIDIYDKGEWEELPRLHENDKTPLVHVCIPYTKAFIEIAQMINDKHSGYMIIHSTVPPGTTQKVGLCSYSPTMGRHADGFSTNMLNYFKPFSGNSIAFEQFRDSSNFDMFYWEGPYESLEFAKISSTNYMYWCLIYEKMIHEECKKNGWKFDRVYTQWNTEYNNGINETYPNLKRPIYKHDPNPIPGGHCLNSNIYLNDDPISKILRNWQEKKGKIKGDLS